MAAPLEPFMTPADKTLLHRMLLVSGAPIGTINAVRKHLSAIKGGRLAVAARRARSRTTLVLCDVDPERHDEVASGPSLPDRTTLDDVIMAIDRYGLAPALPFPVLDGLRDGRIPETPMPRDAIVRRSGSAIVLSNRDLRNAAVRAGLSRGLSAEAVPIDLTGPVEEAMERMARAIETAPQGTRLLVLGGEVTTVPSGGGEGGRAQELALRLAIRMARIAPVGLPRPRERRHRWQLAGGRGVRRSDHARTGPRARSGAREIPGGLRLLRLLQAPRRSPGDRPDRHQPPRPLPPADRRRGHGHPESAASTAAASRIRKLTHPLTVKNAWSTRLRSSGRTSRCSYARRAAAPATPAR